eukprot:TRINITY_DN15159_c0_g1_i1.p1 TRINITY_DN15159_c0_g1~~TRINITY_DN15159_c0_g1_i1.p1  ORF type:complete len:344 (+),score=24.41 TRINITY_DN15159_c0_g1_i1:2-1033(+)
MARPNKSNLAKANSVNAAALQMHIVQRADLCISKSSRRRSSQVFSAQTSASVAKSIQNRTNAPLEHRAYHYQPTLAEKLELVATKHLAPLSEDEWKCVRNRYVKRRRAQRLSQPECAICQDVIGTRRQVLLSCSHSFHATCLRSIERYLGICRCPLCRTEDYQLYYINDGWHCARQMACVRIQSWWRGARTRRMYVAQLMSRYKRNRILAKQFAAQKMAKVSEGLERANQALQTEVDDFLASLDRDQASRAALMAQAHEQTMAKAASMVDWNSVRAIAEPRRADGCPICLQLLDQEQANGVLLRCSHVFHDACLQVVEKFKQEHEVLVCPVCRDTAVRCPIAF